MRPALLATGLIASVLTVPMGSSVAANLLQPATNRGPVDPRPVQAPPHRANKERA